MKKNPELLPDPHTQSLRFSELIPRLEELKAQGCLVNHLRWLPVGYEIAWLPPEVSRRYRSWDDNPRTGQDDPTPCSETLASNPHSNSAHQRELGL